MTVSTSEKAETSNRSPNIPEEIWGIMRRDPNALQLFIDKYSARAQRIAYRILQNPEDAEEAVQEILFRVWQKIHSWDPEYGDFYPWLNQLARNITIDLSRQRYRQKREVLQPKSEDGMYDIIVQQKDERFLPDEIVEQREFRELLDQALALIRNQNHREAWVLRHLNDLSIAEIAEKLGQKQNTVKVWVFRANLELRRVLKRLTSFPFTPATERTRPMGTSAPDTTTPATHADETASRQPPRRLYPSAEQHVCDICGRSFESGKALGGHRGWCRGNHEPHVLTDAADTAPEPTEQETRFTDFIFQFAGPQWRVGGEWVPEIFLEELRAKFLIGNTVDEARSSIDDAEKTIQGLEEFLSAAKKAVEAFRKDLAWARENPDLFDRINRPRA